MASASSSPEAHDSLVDELSRVWNEYQEELDRHQEAVNAYNRQVSDNSTDDGSVDDDSSEGYTFSLSSEDPDSLGTFDAMDGEFSAGRSRSSGFSRADVLGMNETGLVGVARSASSAEKFDALRLLQPHPGTPHATSEPMGDADVVFDGADAGPPLTEGHLCRLLREQERMNIDHARLATKTLHAHEARGDNQARRERERSLDLAESKQAPPRSISRSCVWCNVVEERRHFLMACLSLLDAQTPPGVAMTSMTVLKRGMLKKRAGQSGMASMGVATSWKLKHIELRNEAFIYWTESVSLESRKVIPLRRGTSSVKLLRQKGAATSMIELSAVGHPRRTWMASSTREAQDWVLSIERAMIGGAPAVDTMASPRILDSSPRARQMRWFVKTRKAVQDARTRVSYIASLSAAIAQGAVESRMATVEQNDLFRIPVAWIRREINFEDTSGGQSGCTVRQLWKDMTRDSIEIDGAFIAGSLGPEAIFGALVRAIYRNSRLSSKASTFRHISEQEMLTVAKDILLACNRTQSGGDTYLCVDSLCHNAGLVVICPESSSAEPLRVKISFVDNETEVARALKTVHQSPPSLPASGGLDQKRSSREIGPQITRSNMSLLSPFRRTVEVAFDEDGTARKSSADSSIEDSSSEDQHTDDARDRRRKPRAQNKPHMKLKRTPGPHGPHDQDPISEHAASCHLSVKVSASTAYKICAVDPQGDDTDIWGRIEANWEQEFILYFSTFDGRPRIHFDARDAEVNMEFALSATLSTKSHGAAF